MNDDHSSVSPSGAARLATARGVLLWVRYDGSAFSGFARQPSQVTVAGALEDAVRQLDPGASLIRCASRTDSGVHALAHPVAFDTVKDISSRGWLRGINRYLPDAIAVTRAGYVSANYEPRFDARFKRYRYRILQAAIRDPLLRNRVWIVRHRLNHELMRAGAKLIQGERDFAAFRSSADRRVDTQRLLSRVAVETAADDGRVLEIVVEGTAFLHNMVRIISGTLVDIGRGQLDVEAITRALLSKSRCDLGMTAPPDGLYLEHVELGQAATDLFPAD